MSCYGKRYSYNRSKLYTARASNSTARILNYFTNMPWLSLLSKATIFALLLVMATGTTSKPANSNGTHRIPLLAAITPAFVESSNTLSTRASSFSPTTFTTTTYPLANLANLSAVPEANVNMVTSMPQTYTCEHAERLAKETQDRRCSSFSPLFRGRCYFGEPENCCIKGKGPANCGCYIWWPQEAPKQLPTGQLAKAYTCFYGGD